MNSNDRLYSIIGQLIRTRREQIEFTQEELARRVGLTRTSISNIEGGKQKIQIHTLYVIAEALHVSAHTLLPLPETSGSRNIEQYLPEQLLQELLPAEREWVKRILNK